MSENITVKDLSSALNVSPRDMLTALRNLGLPAKSASSPVPAEHLEKVRAHFNAQDDVISRTQIESGVIVRRRRRSEEAEDSAQTPAYTPDTPATPEKSEAVVAVPSTTQTVTKAAPANTTRPARARNAPRPRRPETPPARIISQPAPPVQPASPQAAQNIVAQTVAQTTQTVTRTPTATDVAPVVSDTTDRAIPADTAPPARLVSAVPVTEPLSTEATPAIQKTARHTTPDASALPEGSSAPTLSQRSQETRPQESVLSDGENDDERRRRRGKKRVVETPTPQVRVISRPSPEAVARAIQERAGGARLGDQQRHPRSDRPDRPSGAGGPRPAGAGGMGAPRPPRTGMAAATGISAASGVPGAGGDMREGQSKKKRTKGRRTVDFQQGAGDFSRRGMDEENTRLNRTGRGRRKGKDIRPLPVVTQPLKAAKRKIRVTEAIRVADMAHQMGLKSSEIIKVLFGLGIMATINRSLDIDTATLVAAEFEYEVEKAGFSEDDYLLPTEADAPETLLPRPPVVTIMGHVDHGKTSLLDAIRKSNITSGEAGGITQHIGAYHVRTRRGEIVFLDTPGHEAFTAMRARGAQVTDLVILVVAADDGVMEQTREAINHSKAAGVPIMVAVNKMDKPGADPDKVLRELADLGLQAEDWGGDTVMAKVSAKTREGLDDLLELVALQAEILEIKANPEKHARGRIVEAKLDKGRGPVATVLIQEGTLRQGDTFVCGVFAGRVRALFNDQGKKVKEAGPSMPMEVQGFDGVPEAGEEFICMADEKVARRIADARAIKQRERDLAKESKVTLETFLSRRASDQEALTLTLVLKADVQGSLEAITEALNKQSTEKVRIQVVHGGAGAISESDVMLASASQAIIIGFNVRPTAKVKEVAEQENVDVRFYNIIYKLVDDIKNAMTGMLAPVQREQYLGQAEVREIFSVPKIGLIAGSHVSDGKIMRNAGTRLLRDGVVVYTGKIASLRRFKDDMREVLKGYECGIGLENYNDVKVGDVIETFEIVEEAATL